MTEFSLEVMGHIDPALVEEIALSGPQKRRRPRLRAAVLAACLCLALVGTGFAANPEAVAALVQRLTVHIFPQTEEPGYDIAGSVMTKYPLSAFSDELLAASEVRTTAVEMLEFASWNEVREFVGRDIPCVWPEGQGDEDRRFLVYLFHTEYDVLWGVDICVTHTTDYVLSDIRIQIRTENWPGEEASAGLHDVDGSYTHLESYSMPNGAVAELIQYAGSEKYPHANCRGYFMKDGILYEVITYGNVPAAEDTQPRLKAVLDSFD